MERFLIAYVSLKTCWTPLNALFHSKLTLTWFHFKGTHEDYSLKQFSWRNKFTVTLQRLKFWSDFLDLDVHIYVSLLTYITTISAITINPADKRKQNPRKKLSVTGYRLLKTSVANNIDMLSSVATNPNNFPVNTK